MNDNKKKQIIREHFFRVFPKRKDMEFVYDEPMGLYDMHYNGVYYFSLEEIRDGYSVDVDSDLKKFSPVFTGVLLDGEFIENDYEVFLENKPVFCELFSELLGLNVVNVF